MLNISVTSVRKQQFSNDHTLKSKDTYKIREPSISKGTDTVDRRARNTAYTDTSESLRPAHLPPLNTQTHLYDYYTIFTENKPFHLTVGIDFNFISNYHLLNR